jgi:hypothetical protein
MSSRDINLLPTIRVAVAPEAARHARPVGEVIPEHNRADGK